MASGLKINLQKSKVMVVGQVPCLREIADIMGCEIAMLPSSYLGLPLGEKHWAAAIWELIVNQLGRKISAWKVRLFFGKLTLFFFL